MRVAHIVTNFPSVSQTFILDQLIGLMDLGHDVKIFAYGAEETIIHPGVIDHSLLGRTEHLNAPENKLVRVLKASQWIMNNCCSHFEIVADAMNVVKYKRDVFTLRRIFEYIPLLKNAPYDIVHCHFGGVGKRVAPILRNVGCKRLAISFYGHDVTRASQIQPGSYDTLMQMGDVFLPLCDSMKEKMLRLGFPADRIICHPLGVNPDRFPFVSRVHKAGQPVSVLTVARLVEKKGLSYGLHAVAKVILEQKANIHYRVIGDGPLKDDLKSLAEELGLTRHVEFIDEMPQDKIIRYYENADLFMLPSIIAPDGDQEGTPTVLLEAQAMGLPILSTMHSGIPEIVENGSSGYLVPERDSNALAERLNHLVGHPEEWPDLGLHGRRIVEKRYDVRDLNMRLEALYKKLLAEET